MLYDLCLEAAHAAYWAIRVVEVADDEQP